ncbi:unnamed protein product [Mytilus edulis]|uniref:Uncharacterized protein n=1 Tax=Mytilus edulis TaxID=6550 RepID=A0A8S3R2Z8_MYTED|nr:unnamed protein product [Mytilus edulis]
MADQTIDNPCPAKLPRLRKTKYSVAEENLIQEDASKYHYILQEKHSNDITNKKKKKIWDGIAVKVNSLGVAYRTGNEIRDKWRNTVSKAKKAFTEQRSSSFTGIDGGLETDIFISVVRKTANYQQKHQCIRGNIRAIRGQEYTSFLIMVDAYSKWIDIHVMNSTTSEATIAKLQQTFATHGLCDLIISDNGAAFTSKEFADYVKSNGIEHRTSAPWHPASNGCAERAVQSFREGTIQEKLNRFLFNYRITPQTTTGLALSKLLMKRKLKSRLDLVFPNIEKRVQEKQQKTETLSRYEICEQTN